MKPELSIAKKPKHSYPVIGSRFSGPSIRREADGEFEAVLPDLTESEERLQDALIAWSLPTTKFKRGLFGIQYEARRE